MIFKLEDLPNELLFNIFNHLSVIDLIYGFYRLNRRFTSLIRTIKHLSIDFSSQCLSKTQFIYIINQLRSLNIESIQLSTRYCVDIVQLFIAYIPPSQLIHLRSLTFIDVERNSIEKFVHHYPQLQSLSIESPSWRSIPRRFLPHFSNLVLCHLPTLDLLSGCHMALKHLTLDHCTTDNLIELNTFAPNLNDLTLTLTNTTNIPSLFQFPIHLISLKLILRSILFRDFERIIKMIDSIKNLSVTFINSEHDLNYFEEYLQGQYWLTIKKHVDNLQLNITVYQPYDSYIINDLIKSFDWYERKIICQLFSEPYGYHLFSLPYIDDSYAINHFNFQNDMIKQNDFLCVKHLHLTVSNKTQQVLSIKNIILEKTFPNLKLFTLISPLFNDNIIDFINDILKISNLRTLKLYLLSSTNNCQTYFNEIIFYLPLTIETLILNTITTKFLYELLDNNVDLLKHLKRLVCSVKDQNEFDTLILLLLETFYEKSLIYLNISSQISSRSNLLSGWLLKTNYLKTARIKCSDRQCMIWF